jgi:AcrR family transcriptional regulator
MNDYETADRLLSEARRLFAERGYRGASVRTITRAAGANLGAVTYHFGTKEALHRAVLERVFGEMAGRIEAAAASPAPALDRLHAVVHAMFAFFREAPDAPRLVLHQLVAGDSLPDAVVSFLRRNLAAIRGIVSDGIAAGQVRPLDPTLVAFTIFAQVVWFAIAGRVIAPVLGELDHDHLAMRMERHVTDVVSRFVTDGGVVS